MPFSTPWGKISPKRKKRGGQWYVCYKQLLGDLLGGQGFRVERGVGLWLSKLSPSRKWPQRKRNGKEQDQLPEKRYLIPYSLDTQKRHHHETQQGKVVWFMVQLEVLVQGEWKAVIRYDCAHGYAHRDRFNLQGNQLKEDIGMDYEEALTFADDDLDDHWEIYRGRFLKGEYP